MKDEINKDMETLKKIKRIKQNTGNKKFLKSNLKTQLKAIPGGWNKCKTEFQGLNTK
jgi:hypothetical protein